MKSNQDLLKIINEAWLNFFNTFEDAGLFSEELEAHLLQTSDCFSDINFAVMSTFGCDLEEDDE